MRFTKKSGYHYYSYGIKEKENKNGSKRQYGNPITKLGKLEDVEEELGIDLITLSEALKNGIWIKKTFIEKEEIKNLFFFYEDVSLYKDCLYACPIDIFDEKVCIYQYGKTWALTKEELL